MSDAVLGEVSYSSEGDLRKSLVRVLPAGVAIGLIACVGAWVWHSRMPAAPEFVVERAPEAPVPAAAPVAKPNPFGIIANPYGQLVDPGFLLGPKTDLAAGATPPPRPSVAAPFAIEPPLPPRREVASIDDVAPLPPPRPSEFGSVVAGVSPERAASPALTSVAPSNAAAPADNSNVFDRLFGLGKGGRATAYAPATTRVAPTAPAASVARASQEPGQSPSLFSWFGHSASAPISGYDKYTAVYDISARTVYLPDGTKLEAHSGYGEKLDDPSHVSERMVGATPPNLYELTPREALFHGVQALRLKPIGEGSLFGRAGLLAHSYMLGPNGDSNGCVSFKDYDAFLHAYQSGQVKRLAVVARLN